MYDVQYYSSPEIFICMLLALKFTLPALQEAVQSHITEELLHNNPESAQSKVNVIVISDSSWINYCYVQYGL